MDSEIADEDVNIKLSVCQKCKGVVRAAVEHMMKKKDIRNFAEEALTYNLSINTIKLSQYKGKKYKWCNCNI